MPGEIPYTKLVKGNRYTIRIRDPRPSELAERPHEGEYVGYDTRSQLAIFINVTTDGEKYAGEDDEEGMEESYFDPKHEIFTDPRVAGTGFNAAWKLRESRKGRGRTRKHKRRARKTRRSLK